MNHFLVKGFSFKRKNHIFVYLYLLIGLLCKDSASIRSGNLNPGTGIYKNDATFFSEICITILNNLYSRINFNLG